MYTSDIENRRHQSLLEHRRWQVADVDVVKIEFADPPPPVVAALRRRLIAMLKTGKPAADSS